MPYTTIPFCGGYRYTWNLVLGKEDETEQNLLHNVVSLKGPHCIHGNVYTKLGKSTTTILSVGHVFICGVYHTSVWLMIRSLFLSKNVHKIYFRMQIFSDFIMHTTIFFAGKVKVLSYCSMEIILYTYAV